jgi:AcrR family transcriptional regulator
MLVMTARGPYAKGKAKRAEILDVALEVIARDGYSGATVKNLAEAVGLSQNGLLHYFGSKDALFAEILRHEDDIAAERFNPATTDFASDLVDRLLDAIEAEIASPGMSQLSLRVTGEATELGHAAHALLRDRYTVIRAVVHDAVLRLQDEGRVPAGLDPTAIATLVFASWDGLRIQWMFDNTIDVRGHMVYLLRSLGLDVPPDL